LRTKKGGFGSAIAEITDAIHKMPVGMHKIGLVFFFQWYAMFIYPNFADSRPREIFLRRKLLIFRE
jgi:maltose/moltooligosaccharide transporter